MMQTVKRLSFVPFMLITLASPALAQQTLTAAPPPGQRGYIAASAGVEFEPPTKPVISIEFGENVHRNAQAYVTFSYFENLMTQDLQDELDEAAALISRLNDVELEFRGRDRGLVLVAGGKYLFGSGNVRPYVGGGAGVINIRRRIVEPRLGDITFAVLNDFGIGELSVVENLSVTRPMVEGAFGVGFAAGATYVDVGYRYRRGFHGTDSFDVSQFSAGIGYKF